jgi:ArsR family transcriptional regulator, arsenate/arsenite/antimonite-responsive transcriptional repressor
MTSRAVKERADAPSAGESPHGSCCRRPDTDQLSALARVAKALSDPIRLGMLDTMAQGRTCCGLIEPAARGVPGSQDPAGICVCEFQERFDLGQSKASYHLRILREAGLVTEEVRGKWTFYELDRQAFGAALDRLHGLSGT